MEKKLFDGEMKLMELIWENEPVSAKALAQLAAQTIGWNKNTTYTVAKKLVEKGAVSRAEPGFICAALWAREDIRRAETESLVNRLYSGSKKALFSALLSDQTLTQDEIDDLRRLIESR